MTRRIAAVFVVTAFLMSAAPAIAQSQHPESDEMAEPPPSRIADDVAGSAVETADALHPVVEAPERRRLTAVASGNLDGDLARPDCRNDDHGGLYWAKHAAYYNALAELADAGELDAPFALTTGNSLFPGALGRYFATGESGGGKQLAELMASLPLEVHGLGRREFAVPRPALVDFVEHLRRQNIAPQAANLHCESFGGAEAICEFADTAQDERPYRIVERDGIRLAITTVVDPAIADRLAPAQQLGLEITDPVDALDGIVESMRDDADLVIVQHQVRPADAFDPPYRIANRVDGIDLVAASYFVDSEPETGDNASDSQRMAVVKSARTTTPIVSFDSGRSSAINVELDLVDTGHDEPDWHLRKVIPRRVDLEDYAPHPATADRLLESVRQYCDDWGDPIGEHSGFDEPFELEDFQQFALNIMRFSTRAEVAVSNRGAFRNQARFPLTNRLTKADVYTALPFENQLVTARAEGSKLAALAGRLDDDLVAVGLTVDGGSPRINGRPIDEDRLYRVAINEFLSVGGDDVFDPAELSSVAHYHPGWSDTPPTIAELIVEYIESGRHLRDGAVRDSLSAHGNFPDLNRQFLWRFTSSLNASYNQVAVTNPLVDGEAGYDRSELTVQSTDELNLEGRFVSDADSRNHGWNNTVDVQFATARIQDDDEARFEQTKDRARLRSRYRYKRLRADLEGRWYVPDPFAEGQIETEFVRPDTRDWHRLHLRAIAGASFQLLAPLDVRIGMNVNQDINDPQGRPTWGVNLGYTLARISPVQLMDRPIRFESEVEYFYNDIANDNIHELRTSNRVLFAVFDQFFFTTTFNAFAFRNDPVGELGTNTEVTVGVNYQWEHALQNF